MEQDQLEACLVLFKARPSHSWRRWTEQITLICVPALGKGKVRGRNHVWPLKGN